MDKYRSTSTKYHVTAIEEEGRGFYSGEITLEKPPIHNFINRRMKGLKIPFYADSHDVVFESSERLDYPRSDIMREVDKRYLETFMQKISEKWVERFKPKKRNIIGRMSHCKRNVSAEFKEILKRNVGKTFVDYSTSIGIKPEEFAEVPKTTLDNRPIMPLWLEGGYDMLAEHINSEKAIG